MVTLLRRVFLLVADIVLTVTRVVLVMVLTVAVILFLSEMVRQVLVRLV